MSRVAELALGAQKFLAAASAVVAIGITDGLVNGTAEKWTTALIAAAGAALVYFLPNKDADGNTVNTSEQAVQNAVQDEKAKTVANSLPVSETPAIVVPDSGTELPTSDTPAL